MTTTNRKPAEASGQPTRTDGIGEGKISQPEPPREATRAIERVIILPWPSPALSPNSRTHWRARVKAMKADKLLASIHVRNSGWIAPPWDRIHLWINFYPPTKRLPDDDNMLARCKGYRDGIAEALGIDDRVFVSHPYVHDEVRKHGEVHISITAGETP